MRQHMSFATRQREASLTGISCFSGASKVSDQTPGSAWHAALSFTRKLSPRCLRVICPDRNLACVRNRQRASLSNLKTLAVFFMSKNRTINTLARDQKLPAVHGWKLWRRMRRHVHNHHSYLLAHIFDSLQPYSRVPCLLRSILFRTSR